MLGQVMGSYRLVEELGRGGMGVVYIAEHTILGRRAALKVLLPVFSRQKEIVERFFTEAKATTQIKHPGIVGVFDFGYHDDGSAYIVMELLEGESLQDRIDRLGTLPTDQALTVCRQVAGALRAAHEAGIVHRDLKPDNIFLVSDPEVEGGERAKLLDFGVAKLTNETAGASKTQTGALMGTPTYMSPEQCKGAGKVDHRSDLYSLGCILYQLLCGQPPFVRDGAGEVLGAHMYEEPPPPHTLEPAVDRKIEALILRLLAKDPDERYQNASELIEGLERLRSFARTPPAGITIPPVNEETITSAVETSVAAARAAAAITADPRTTFRSLEAVDASKAGAGDERKSRLLPLLVVGALVLGAAVGGYVYVHRSGTKAAASAAGAGEDARSADDDHSSAAAGAAAWTDAAPEAGPIRADAAPAGADAAGAAAQAGADAASPATRLTPDAAASDAAFAHAISGADAGASASRDAALPAEIGGSPGALAGADAGATRPEPAGLPAR